MSVGRILTTLVVAALLAACSKGFDPASIDGDIQGAELALAAASTPEEKSAATDSLNAWRNLKAEALQVVGAAH